VLGLDIALLVSLSCVCNIVEFRGGQIGRSLEATALCVVYVSWLFSMC